MGIVCLVGQLFFYALFARILLSWFPIAQGGAMASVFSALYAITEPVLGPVRRAIPPVRMGGMGLDVSVIIVVFGLQILLQLIGC